MSQGDYLMLSIAIEKEISETSGRYVARIDGCEGKAEITFTVFGPDLIRADHTNAPETMRGTGAAKALVEFMVADARKAGFTIIASCPYVRAQVEKNPDWDDVVTR
jgi:predicted GNAT family acetyltransferase